MRTRTEMEREHERFMKEMDYIFNSNIPAEKRLKSSAKTARENNVSRSRTINSIKELDAYFMH